MKILYCHNYYRNRGGEDISFESDVQMLRQRGHTVIPYTLDNRELTTNQLKLASQTLWNRHSYRSVKRIIDTERPDILHCNNLFPQISISVYRAARRRRVPVVQALRNYRTFCASSFLFRQGNVCTKCLTKTAAWYGLIHRCYRDSLSATTMVVGMQMIHRVLNVQKKLVDAYVTPTAFARQVHIDGGFDPAKIFVRCNFLIPDHGMVSGDQGYALFVGRLSEEKGCDTMIDAWLKHRVSVPLRIVGDGPAESLLKRQAIGCDAIRFLGKLESNEVLQELTNAKFLVMPSRWYETFGRTIAESFSRGTPVIASRLGAMSELVDEGRNGFLFDPGDSKSLADTIKVFNQTYDVGPELMQLAARQTYERRFSSELSYAQLLSVYDSAASRAGATRTIQKNIEQAIAEFDPFAQLIDSSNGSHNDLAVENHRPEPPDANTSSSVSSREL